MNKVDTSYVALKKKYAACQVEIAELEGIVKLFQTELHSTKLLGVVVPVFSITEREQLESLKNDNVHLQRGIAASRREMEELRNKIDILSDDNDVLSNRVNQYVEKDRVERADSYARRRCVRDNKRAVLRAFGWKLSKVNPTLLLAACGFWNATIECTERGQSRASFKRRKDLWIDLTTHAFNGLALKAMEKQFYERAKFNVVEICRKSDCESQLMPVHCSPCVRILCPVPDPYRLLNYSSCSHAPLSYKTQHTVLRKEEKKKK